MGKLIIIILIFNIVMFSQKEISEENLKRAKELAQKFLMIDTHIDLPHQLSRGWYDVSERNEKGHFDYERAIEGGLNVAFMSIYMSPTYEFNGAKNYADTLIGFVNRIVETHPDKFKIVNSTNDVLKNFPSDKVLLAMGMENGSPIEGDLNNIKYFYDKGIRYITLSHTKNNHICDSSGEEEKKWNGLSPFGKEVIKEMNRIGILVDISHVSDSTFYQALELSAVPVFASHSNVRHFTKNLERNMTDEMIIALAKKGGVINVLYGSFLIKDELIKSIDKRRDELTIFLKENNYERNSPEAREFLKQYNIKNPNVDGNVWDVVDIINHIVKLVGIDYVGMGSDFDGVGALPVGLKDVSQIPNLIAALLEEGYSEEDIEKICSKNFLRVWKAAEDYAKQFK